MAAQPVIDITSSPAGTQSRNAPSSHRLATVSASDALQDLEDGSSSAIRTGIPSLDAALLGSGARDGGGLERTKVTEIWGPNGTGTTAIALQASANALKDGSTVVWVGCGTPLSTTRIESLLVGGDRSTTATVSSKERMECFRYIPAPTLSHLLALVLRPPPDLVTQRTALLVVDNLNIAIDIDYPRAQTLGSTRTDAQKWQAGRRYAVLGSLVTAMNKLAALNNLAVVVTTGCAMRSRSDSGLGGALAPGVGGTEWDSGVWNRLALFRDFAGRFVGIQKCGGKSLISREEVGEGGRIIGFDIKKDDGALRERLPGQASNGAVTAAQIQSSPVKSRKRYFDEVADSEGEDEYGWDAGDEDVFATTGTLVPEGSTTAAASGPNDSTA